jgi:hypothetical protein
MHVPERSSSVAGRSAALRFAGLCLLVVACVGGYVLVSRGRAVSGDEGGGVAPIDAARLADLRRRPHLVFRRTALGPAYGRVAVVPLDSPQSPPMITGLSCDRVYASATQGLCLQASRGVFTRYKAIAFDELFVERHAFALAGAPSRTRVAPDAPLAASTVFVSGDSYAAGAFSTRTVIYDLSSQSAVGDLEDFSVIRDGRPFKRPDFNFWGVTFARDGDRFFATLATGGGLSLVEGSVADRRVTVAAADVECPMLSPDGSRLAYKRRVVEGGRLGWRLRVLNLQTRAVTDLAEWRNVDDQPEWLNDHTVLYALPRDGSASSDIWSAAADGTGVPELYLADAFSPSVARRVL